MNKFSYLCTPRHVTINLSNFHNMAIHYACEDVELPNNSFDNISKWITAIIDARGCHVGRINYLFCSDDYIIDINSRFLNHDTYTDVITFDSVNADNISGDILISVDRVADNAQKFNVSFDNEILRVIIHGVLHLLGQGDKTESEAQKMRQLESEALSLYYKMFHVEQ